MNPFSRFLKGFKHGYGTQQGKRLEREAVVREMEAARRVENTASSFTLGNRIVTASEINFGWNEARSSWSSSTAFPCL